MIPLINVHTHAQMKFIFQAASCTADWGRGGKRTKIERFSLRAVEVQAVPVGFLGFGVGWLYNLQSYTHTAVRCRRAGGRRLGSNRKTGSSL